MSNFELSYDRLPLVDGELDLSDDRQSCRLFLAGVLDCAADERAEQVSFNPTDGDKCLAVVIRRGIYQMVPIPSEVRATYLRFIQEIVLGRLAYLFLVRVIGRPFTRNDCGSVIVDVGGRRSKWIAECNRDSVRFVRVL